MLPPLQCWLLLPHSALRNPGPAYECIISFLINCTIKVEVQLSLEYIAFKQMDKTHLIIGYFCKGQGSQYSFLLLRGTHVGLDLKTMVYVLYEARVKYTEIYLMHQSINMHIGLMSATLSSPTWKNR